MIPKTLQENAGKYVQDGQVMISHIVQLLGIHSGADETCPPYES